MEKEIAESLPIFVASETDGNSNTICIIPEKNNTPQNITLLDIYNEVKKAIRTAELAEDLRKIDSKNKELELEYTKLQFLNDKLSLDFKNLYKDHKDLLIKYDALGKEAEELDKDRIRIATLLEAKSHTIPKPEYQTSHSSPTTPRVTSSPTTPRVTSSPSTPRVTYETAYTPENPQNLKVWQIAENTAKEKYVNLYIKAKEDPQYEPTLWTFWNSNKRRGEPFYCKFVQSLRDMVNRDVPLALYNKLIAERGYTADKFKGRKIMD